METIWRKKYESLIYICIGLTLVFLGCQVGTQGPDAWIDFPSEGSNVALGEQQTVISHAFASEGIAEAVLYVNGEAWTKDVPLDPHSDFSEITFMWIPQTEGLQTLQVLAYDSGGKEFRSDPITVNTVQELATIVPATVITTTLGTTIVPPTLVETPTNTVTLVDTPTTISAIDTPTTVITPVPVIQFWADPSTINAGGCTTINWFVKDVQAVFLGDNEQPFQGTYTDCLCADKSYTLTILHYDGQKEKRQVDVLVNGSCETPTLSDIVPPPPPKPSVPSNNIELSCRGSQNLAWLPVDDPSGIEGYYGQIERRASPQEKFSPYSQWGPVTSKQYNVSVECGWYYRWRVRAEDGEGNLGNWSPWLQFSITFN